MAFHVLRQVVAPHESSLADSAGEFLLAGMRAFVPRQFIAAREAAIAIVIRTRERSLASVSTSMSLQVRRFKIILAAALVLAFVNTAPRLRHTCIRRGCGGGRWCRAGD